MSSDTIEIEARVARFLPNAMRDHFEAGAFASYDATELEILAPPHLRGKALTIIHTQQQPPTSPWREPGKELRFAVKEDALAGEETLFDGALSNVREG